MAHQKKTSLEIIEYFAEKNTLEISIRLSLHDLGHVYEDEFKKTGLTVSNNIKLRRKIAKKTAVDFLIHDTKTKQFYYSYKDIIGTEVNDYFLWIYFEKKNVQKEFLQRIYLIDNKILLDKFPEQLNLVVFKWGNLTRSLYFYKDLPSRIFDMNPKAKLKEDDGYNRFISKQKK